MGKKRERGIPRSSTDLYTIPPFQYVHLKEWRPAYAEWLEFGSGDEVRSLGLVLDSGFTVTNHLALALQRAVGPWEGIV
ncbi:hypothetical protein J6590_007338 [Homalodisca vitripennis]|nr:hypothetical protein J6590_007338 [Homalodisca vitripennis]